MYIVDNMVCVGLKLNGVELDLWEMPFSMVVLREHYSYYLPTLEFIVVDPNNYFIRHPITDSSKIEVCLARTAQSVGKWAPFRVFSKRMVKGLNVRQYNVSCIYDAPSYWKSKRIEAYDCTASEVISQIAADEKFNFDGDPSIDKMIWRNTNKTRCQFLKQDVVPRSTSGQVSYFRTVFTHKLGGLRFKNLTNLMSEQPKAVFSNFANEDVDYMILEMNPYETPGPKNRSQGGYGTRISVFDSVKGSNTLTTGVKVQKNLPNLNLRKDMVSNKTPSVHEFLPINIGNIPIEYQIGEAQNNRVGSTWSSYIDILVMDTTAVDCFDTVKLSVILDSGTGELDSELNGSWVVVGKAKVAMYNHYVEKLCLARSGIGLQDRSLF